MMAQIHGVEYLRNILLHQILQAWLHLLKKKGMLYFGACDGAPSRYHILPAAYLTYMFYYMLSRTSKTVYPPPQLVFSSLNLTPLHKVKGKLCYH